MTARSSRTASSGALGTFTVTHDNTKDTKAKISHDSIAKGDFPRWDLSIQIMTEDQAKKYKENPFDLSLECKEPPLEIKGAMDSYEPKDDATDDCFYQAGDLYRLMTEDKKVILIDNTARNIAEVTANIKYRHTAQCYLTDSDYGTRLATALALNLDKIIKLSETSHQERMWATSAV